MKKLGRPKTYKGEMVSKMFYISTDILHLLKVKSETTGRSVSSIINEILLSNLK